MIRNLIITLAVFAAFGLQYAYWFFDEYPYPEAQRFIVDTTPVSKGFYMNCIFHNMSIIILMVVIFLTNEHLKRYFWSLLMFGFLYILDFVLFYNNPPHPSLGKFTFGWIIFIAFLYLVIMTVKNSTKNERH